MTCKLLSGHASPAHFESSPSGHSEDTFKLEWKSKSFTPIEEFLLEVSLSPSGSWTKYSIVPTKEGAFYFAGKQFLTELQPATKYKARVTAKNGEGWGQPGPVWNFATKGAGWHHILILFSKYMLAQTNTHSFFHHIFTFFSFSVPSPASVTASATSFSSSIKFLLPCFTILILTLQH